MGRSGERGIRPEGLSCIIALLTSIGLARTLYVIFRKICYGRLYNKQCACQPFIIPEEFLFSADILNMQQLRQGF